MNARALSSSLLVAAASGCALEPGTVVYRREPPTSRIEDYSAPGSIVTLGPAEKNMVTCPHCGATNKLGHTHCGACGRRLTRLPQWKPCPRCGGKFEEDQVLCEFCGGRGWIRELPPEGEEEAAEAETGEETKTE